MTDSHVDAGPPPVSWKNSNAIAARRRNVVRARNLSLVALAVAVITAWILYNRPAHSYEVGANSTAWSADVTTALAKRPSGGNFVPVGPLSELPGVGKIVEIIVDKAPSRKGTAVFFLSALDANYAGLVYLDNFPPPEDSCNYHLGGPWWELTPLNDATMGCPRGFHYTGGG
jgi:hypothetical protein